MLALIFHHVVGDARSAFPVLTEVLAALAGEAPDPAGEELLPPLSALYPPQLSGEAGRLALEQLKAARKAAFERLGPSAAQPVFTAVATHVNGMTLNLNYNANQFGTDDAGAVAATLLRLLRGAAA